MFASEFEVPENYRLKEKEDYKKYEKDFIEGAKFLMEMPVNYKPKKRSEVKKFVMTWMMGSPDVMIEISELALFKGSEEYLLIFMSGWSLEHLNSKKFDDKLSGYVAGIEAVLKFYEDNNSILKADKLIKKYAKLKKKEKLASYIESKI
jgi:hypothetical protein